MAHPVTGKAGAITFGGIQANFRLLSWTLTVTSKNIETTAAGDTYTDRVHLTNDWKLEFEGQALDQAGWDLGQGNAAATPLVGTEAAATLKRKSGDTAAYFSDTGLVTDIVVSHPSDGATTVRGTMMSSDGSAGPTFDDTPAT